MTTNTARVVVITGLVAFLVHVFTGNPIALAQESVTVKGAVVNGTVNASLPDEIQVLMLVTDADGSTVTTAHTLTDASGQFEFVELPSVRGGRYTLGANHLGTLYTLGLSLDELAGNVTLNVYETTTDATVVRVTHHLTVLADVDVTAREMTFIDFVTLVNESGLTLQPDLSVPAQMSFLRFSLPPLAETIGMQSDLTGGDIVSVGTGFAVTSQVPPGQHSMEFSYKLPYQGGSITYRHAFHQGVEVFQVLIPERYSGMEVSPLERVSSPNLDGTLYTAWEQRDLGRSEELMLTLSHIPQPGLALRVERWLANGVFWQVAIPSLLGLVLTVLLLWGGLRPSRGGSTAEAQGSSTAYPQDGIIREIAHLDERFHRGELEETLYQTMRDTLKGQILAPTGQSEQELASRGVDGAGD